MRGGVVVGQGRVKADKKARGGTTWHGGAKAWAGRMREAPEVKGFSAETQLEMLDALREGNYGLREWPTPETHVSGAGEGGKKPPRHVAASMTSRPRGDVKSPRIETWDNKAYSANSPTGMLRDVHGVAEPT